MLFFTLDLSSEFLGLISGLVFLLLGDGLESMLSELLLLFKVGLSGISILLSLLLFLLCLEDLLPGCKSGLLSLTSESLLVHFGESGVLLSHLVEGRLLLLIFSLLDLLGKLGCLLSLDLLSLNLNLENVLLLLLNSLSFSDISFGLLDFNFSGFLSGLLSKLDELGLLLLLNSEVLLLVLLSLLSLLDHGFLSLLLLDLGRFQGLDSSIVVNFLLRLSDVLELSLSLEFLNGFLVRVNLKSVLVLVNWIVTVPLGVNSDPLLDWKVLL